MRVLLSIDRLQPSGSVHVRRGRNFASLFGFDQVGHQHEWRGVRMVEVIANALLQYRRREGTERLTMLDAAIQNVFHLRPPRIGHDTSIAQGPRSELHPSLKPSRNLAVRYPPGRLTSELFITQLHDP